MIKQKEQVDITNLSAFSMDEANTVVPAHEGTVHAANNRIRIQPIELSKRVEQQINQEKPFPPTSHIVLQV